MFLLFLVAASALLNLKNKYVQLLLMYLSIDFVIHFIIRYGMNEAILFGGHWMFAVPILLGWHTHDCRSACTGYWTGLLSDSLS